MWQVGKQYQHLLSSTGDLTLLPLPEFVAPTSALGSGGKRVALSEQTSSIANSPRGLHTSLKGGLDNLTLLNIGTSSGPGHQTSSTEIITELESKEVMRTT